MIETLFTRPIPKLEPLNTACRIGLDHGDPRGMEILVNLDDLGIAGESYYARRDGGNAPYHRRIDGAIDGLWLRESVASSLAAADRRLRQAGLHVYVLDAYRSLQTQKGLWDHCIALLRAQDPAACDATIAERARRFVSEPTMQDDTDHVPPHLTGGAVDLTIHDAHGPLEMGTGFDDATEIAATAHFETLLQQERINETHPVLRHCRLLYWVMVDAGFTNYPAEWWHFDLGTRLHIAALRSMRRIEADALAWYGFARNPEAVMEHLVA